MTYTFHIGRRSLILSTSRHTGETRIIRHEAMGIRTTLRNYGRLGSAITIRRPY